MRKFLLLFFLGFFLAGCVPNYPTLFENPVCKPPCWQNITLGITTKQDALAILGKIGAGGKPVIDRNKSENGFDDWISFDALNDQSNIQDGYIS
jgi:hypothetical protein